MAPTGQGSTGWEPSHWTRSCDVGPRGSEALDVTEEVERSVGNAERTWAVKGRGQEGQPEKEPLRGRTGTICSVCRRGLKVGWETGQAETEGVLGLVPDPSPSFSSG